MKIITNNTPRNVLYGYELTEKELAEFDYIDSEELQTHSFIRYKGWVYDLSEFMLIPHQFGLDFPGQFDGWHGYLSDSYFSGVLVRYSDDCEQVIMGTYIN